MMNGENVLDKLYFENLSVEDLDIISACIAITERDIDIDEPDFRLLVCVTPKQFNQIAKSWPENRDKQDVQIFIYRLLLHLLNYPYGDGLLSTTESYAANDIIEKLNNCPLDPQLFTKQALLSYRAEDQKLNYSCFAWADLDMGSEKEDETISINCLNLSYQAFFAINKVVYSSAIQAVMAEKARLFSHVETLKKILTASSFMEAKALGDSIKSIDAKVWKEK